MVGFDEVISALEYTYPAEVAIEIEVRVDRPANGGAGVGRDDSGRAVFCEGALPGEYVRVELTQEKKRFARGVVTEVLEPAAGRIEASCPTSLAGCGGCDRMVLTMCSGR